MHRVRPRLRTAFVAAALSLAVPAVPAGAQPLRFERLTIEQGLSQSTANSVVEDDLGFLWIGTQDGLNRYDGYGFKTYRHDPDDPGSLSSN